MRQKTKVNLLGREIEIILNNDNDPKHIACTRQEGENGEKFIMEFFGLPDFEVVVHECWHCIFRVLWRVDGSLHLFRELMDEVYAYVFSDFVKEVMKVLANDKNGKDKKTIKLS